MEGNKEISIVDMPTDIIEKIISPKLSSQDLGRLARTSKGINSLFKKPLIDAKLTRLLEHVAFGEQDQADKILKLDPTLLLMKGKVTDYSDRTFNDITAFQYALWALDWHMWTMLLKYLPKEIAAIQFQELEEKGTAHGKHFSLLPLIEAVNMYGKNCARWMDSNASYMAGEHWRRNVGGAQRMVPAHVVNQYCHPTRTFYPCPTFDEKVLPRSMGVGDRREDSSIVGNWFMVEERGVGDKIGFFRYKHETAVIGSGPGDYHGEMSFAEVEALRSLWKMCQLQLKKLKSKLKYSIPVTSSPIENPLSKSIRQIAKLARRYIGRKLKFLAYEDLDAIEEKIKKELGKSAYTKLLESLNTASKLDKLAEEITNRAVDADKGIGEDDKQLHSFIIKLAVENYLNNPQPSGHLSLTNK